MENLPDPDMSTIHDIVSGDIKNVNALQESILNQKKQEIENKYASQKTQSDIDYKNALTQASKLQSKYYPQDIMSQINNRNALTAKNQFDIANPLLGSSGFGGDQAALKYFANQSGQAPPSYLQVMDAYKQQQAQQNALMKQRLTGGYRGMGVDQRALIGLNAQLLNDHPDWTPEKINDASNAYLSGSNSFSNGEPLPELGGQASQLITDIQGSKAPVAVKNQASNLDVLVNDLNDFDIDSVKQFAGPSGVIKLKEAQAKMAINPNDPSIDPMARRYLSSMNQMIINMDSMRKAFGTSVVPDYVYKTIGKLSNPNSSIWNDPIQVEQNFNDVVKTMTKNRDAYMEKVRHGVTAPIGRGKQQAELKGQGTPVNLYGFKGKEDFNDWLKDQDYETQQSVLKKLKKGK